MGSEENSSEAKAPVVTQASFGGFDRSISAKDLCDFLEKEVGMIWRCRLKKSWTPPESFPNFEADTSKVKPMNDYQKVEPHAFVHFVSPETANKAYIDAGRSALMLNGRPLKVRLGMEGSFGVKRRIADPYKFSNVTFEIGSMFQANEFWAAWKGTDLGIDFLIDPFDDTCKILLTRETAFSFKSRHEQAVIKCNFKLEFMVRDILRMKHYSVGSQFALLLEFMSSPFVYYRTSDDDIYDTVPFNLLDDEDPWIRTTDFTSSGAIGRCNTYKISFSPRFDGKLKNAMAYLRQRKIAEDWPNLQLVARDEAEYGCPMSNVFYHVPCKEGISFDVLFLVNCLVHSGIINRHQLSEAFFGLLRNHTPELNVVALRQICSYKRPIFDACKSLTSIQEWLIKNPKLIKTSQIPDGSVEVRRLIITPTKAYCLPSVVELSNRVLRRYKDVADRFLRVTFTDEAMQKMNNNSLNFFVAPIVRDITSNFFLQKTTIFRRVKSILSEGFPLCGRKYFFLAFSSNQLRDQSAWFFADDDKTKVSSIWRWMGKFTDKNVAKNAARMGLCFSSTIATVNVPSERVNSIPDIKRNGFVFSDGVGKISMDLAVVVAEKLQLIPDPPSAYQIRYAGYKGVIACWPGNNDGYHLSLRPSMDKFRSNHRMLEVVSWSYFQPGFLNRQIVTLLSALGVPDDVFEKMQDRMLFKLNKILENADVAYEVLTTSCAQHGNNAAMMLSAGFRPQTEPYLRGMLSCLWSAQVGDLLHKARIFVPLGRWLLGCLDELGVLEHGQCFVQVSNPLLEKSFNKHGSRFSGLKNNAKVIIGTLVIAKNPCLHPGDIRILEAVDAPGLHHLVDCLVFPQKGDRPHTDEASGSDLDGDLYFVTWDENLIPPGKKSWPPMDYSSGEVKELRRRVKPQMTHQDMVNFFLQYMVTDSIGVISNAHVVHADLSDSGALDEKCLKLAELAACAVDFPKTGKVINMPQHLKPKVYPDFMEKHEFQSYRSDKVLGRLYRKTKDVYNEDTPLMEHNSPSDISYDTDLQVQGSEDFLWDAWDKKCSYDGALNALLGQYKVNYEEEVVTGHVWSMPKYSSRKQGDLKERLKRAYTALRKESRHYFEAIGPGYDELTEDERNAIFERKASAWYQVTYHPEWIKRSIDSKVPDGDNVPVRLSFAWIAADYLVRIKVRTLDLKKVDNSRPINVLANYISERI
ncbi:RNA-dependent RNA polymerase 6-like [Aristolochia californica]|uniref:RNA-dependent RNA polymerase 6-like n=1 Tax=Aristolochia californica TaxID=171875 RepID=UPI0035DE79EE